MNDKMVDKFEMSLDDLIKSSEARRGGDYLGRGKQEDHQRRRRNFRRFGGSGGVQKGRGGGGITRSNEMAEVNTAWKHNIFERLGSQKVSGARKNAQGYIVPIFERLGSQKLSDARINARSNIGPIFDRLGSQDVSDARINARGNMGPTKLMVSNLHFEVSDSDIRDLFENFGPLISATVHYDRSGRSLGRADVIFEKQSDAIKAMNLYNGAPLDGKEMKVQLTTSEIPSPMKKTSGVKSRLKYQDRSHRQVGGTTKIGAGRPAERGRNPRNQKKPLTAEELDAELDAYRAERN